MWRRRICPAGDDTLVLLSTAAKEIGLSTERLRQLIAAGDVQGEKIGGRFYAMPQHGLTA